MFKLLPLVFLASCQLYGGASIHDTSFDSEMEEDTLITTIGMSQEFNENMEVYIEHHSMPHYRETTGYGTNEVGFRVKTKIGN